MTSPVPTNPRPRVVDIAFWLLVAGAVLLVLSGLLAVTVSFDAIRTVAPSSVTDDQVRDYLTYHRGSGIICIVAGAALGFLSGKMRQGDLRFRNATVALVVVIVVLVVLVVVFSMANLLAVLALLPIIIGGLLLIRPVAARWFAGEPL